MNTFTQGVFLGVVAVLVLDTVGSMLARHLKFWYGKLAPVSGALWASSAALAAQTSTDIPATIVLGTMAGAIVGVVDSTVGWWISWQIGPGRPSSANAMSVDQIRQTIVRVTITAGVSGAIGSLFFKLATR